MRRRKARELAFSLLFDAEFNKDYSADEIINSLSESLDIEPDEYAVKVFKGTLENVDAIDALIEKHCISWKKNRISRVLLAIMRLSIYEMLYLREVSVSVAINEAVEIAKKYEGVDAGSFVNGVLGSIARENLG